MTLMQRRRALMTAQGGSDVLFEWFPTDGISNLVLYASNGNPNYELLSDALRLKPAGSWVRTMVRLPSKIQYDGSATIEVEYKNINTNARASMSVHTNAFDGNNYAILHIYDRKLYLYKGDSAIDNVSCDPIPTSGTIKIIFNKDANTISVYLNNVLKLTNTPEASAETTSLCGYSGQTSGGYYVDITHIKITKGVSA